MILFAPSNFISLEMFVVCIWNGSKSKYTQNKPPLCEWCSQIDGRHRNDFPLHLLNANARPINTAVYSLQRSFFWADIAIVLESSRRWMCGGRRGCWPHILSDKLVPDELDEEVVKRAAAAALEDVRLVRTSRCWAATSRRWRGFFSSSDGEQEGTDLTSTWEFFSLPHVC